LEKRQLQVFLVLCNRLAAVLFAVIMAGWRRLVTGGKAAQICDFKQGQQGV
jgi:hypothetical protein